MTCCSRYIVRSFTYVSHFSSFIVTPLGGWLVAEVHCAVFPSMGHFSLLRFPPILAISFRFLSLRCLDDLLQQYTVIIVNSFTCLGHFILFLVTPVGRWLVAVGTLWGLFPAWVISFCFLSLHWVDDLLQWIHRAGLLPVWVISVRFLSLHCVDDLLQ